MAIGRVNNIYIVPPVKKERKTDNEQKNKKKKNPEKENENEDEDKNNKEGRIDIKI
jgi:hypothetical protein